MKQLITIAFLLTISFCCGQGFRLRQYFQGSTYNSTKGVCETTPGNYIAGGYIYDTVQGIPYERLCLIGMNNQGQVLWTKKYGNKKLSYSENYFSYHQLYKRGNYIYFISTAKDSNNTTVGTLIKINFNGDTLWQKIYRDTVDQIIPQAITGSVDNGFLITGVSDNAAYQACLILKTDADGNELWRKKIHKGIPDAEDGRAIRQDSATQKIIIAGYQYIGDTVYWETFTNVLILDSAGNLLSRESYGPRNTFFLDLIQTRDKNFVLAGRISQNIQVGFTELTKNYVVKIDINSPATPIWTLQTGINMGVNGLMSISELDNGNLIAGGYVDTSSVNNLHVNELVSHTKISSNGVIINSRFYDYKTNGPFSDNSMFMHYLVPTSDNGLICAIEVANTNTNPFFIVKYDSTGCDSSLAYCASIATGIQSSHFQSHDITIYPNPSNGNFTICLPNEGQYSSLYLTDVTGAVIWKKTISKTDENHCNVSDLPKGLYFLSVESQNSNPLVKKIVIE